MKSVFITVPDIIHNKGSLMTKIAEFSGMMNMCYENSFHHSTRYYS